jgi:ferredoxin
MGAITIDDVAVIDQERCVDCGVCERSSGCPTESLQQPVEPWPRSVRATFSNPLFEHKETRIPGRGTEEMKTNDVTGRYRHGFAGMAMELGRPGTGTSFRDVEKVARTVAELGVEFEPKNPVTCLMVDRKSGQLNPEVLGERVLSAIVEFTVPLEKVPAVLEGLHKVSTEIDTVFSLDLISRVGPDGSVPTVPLAKSLGLSPSINGKANIGLGRPLAQE